MEREKAWIVLETLWEEFKAAPSSVQRGLYIYLAIALAVVTPVIVALTAPWRTDRDAGGIVQTASGVVVRGVVAFKQEDWKLEKWSIAVVWGGALHEWRADRRVYLTENGDLKTLRSDGAPDFRGLMSAHDLVVAEALNHLGRGGTVVLRMRRKGAEWEVLGVGEDSPAN